MRLDRPFTRLLLQVDSAVLASELDALDETWWRPHPQGMPGNTALPLVAVEGDPADDGLRGPMRATPALAALPYARQVLAGLGTVVGRSRFMRMEGEAEVVPHVDSHHYWWDRVRIHVPVRTDPSVRFEVGEDAASLAAGEVWVVDTWRRHRVVNPADRPRTHLVIDTVGTPAFWDLVARSAAEPTAEPLVLPYRPGADVSFPTETVNQPLVMSPWELAATLDDLEAELRRRDPEGADALVRALHGLRPAWRSTWARYGDGPGGWSAFDRIRADADRALLGLAGRHRLDNGLDAVEAVRSLVLRPALDPQRTRPLGVTSAGRRERRIQRPVIIVSPPRSGSTLLFETLARSPDLHTVGGESHHLIESITELTPAARRWASNRLDASDATEDVVARLHQQLEEGTRDRDGTQVRPPRPIRLLEKTPKNALRVPFLAAAFPDAVFVYLYRDPREAISSMLDAWRTGAFVTYPDLPGWPGAPWSLLLTPGWRELSGAPLAEVVARQWVETTTTLLDDLEALPADRWCVASYDRLVGEPDLEIRRLCAHLDLGWDVDLGDELPLARHTVDSPHPAKWRRNAEELDAVWATVQPVAERAHHVFADPPRVQPVAPWLSAEGTAGRSIDPGPLRSVHTEGFAELLAAADVSLLVSTYRSNRVIIIRPDGDRANTHFRAFPGPMGMAVSDDLLALGTSQGVWVFQDQPDVGAKLEPRGRHDACFLPRAQHVTGDIRIHDVAFVGSELWVVNTRFSCLASLDGRHSFVPRWRPPFVSALAADDRCHLNGMAVSEGEVTHVTALGATDEPGGWRTTKATGGVLIDVRSNEVVAGGLSMPHSPRQHDGRLWVLESGTGTLGVVDVDRGTVETVAHLPGFTRGLAFAGPLAFVGLSQVREPGFAGVPLTDELDQRACGVWVVDLRTGALAGFLRFEGSVQEIYDVQVLAGRRWPEIVEPGADLVAGSFLLPAAPSPS